MGDVGFEMGEKEERSRGEEVHNVNLVLIIIEGKRQGPAIMTSQNTMRILTSIT